MSEQTHSPQTLEKIIENESKGPKYTPLVQVIGKEYDNSEKFTLIYGLAAIFYDIIKKDNIKINISPKYVFIDQNIHPFIDREKLKSDSDTQEPKDFLIVNTIYKQFLPPEVIERGSSSENPEERMKGDAFIFGSLCFALFTLKTSFDVEQELDSYIEDIPLSLTNLIKSCWETDFTKRPTFSDILQIMSRQDFIDEICNIDVDTFKEYQKTVVDKEFIQDLKLTFSFDLTKIPKINICKYEDFCFGKQIGKGGFGIVKLATDRKNGNKKLASKQLNININLCPLKDQIRLYREIEILATTNNYAVQKLYGVIIADPEKRRPYCILTKLEENGGLDKVIEKSSPEFDFTQKYITMYGIAAGMYYLHNKNIMHRDVKTENVLMNENLEPIITDFGLSKKVVDKNNLFQSMAQTGTMIFMAPELLDGAQYVDYALYDARMADVYAFGNVVYHIFTGTPPYSEIKNSNKIVMNISNGILPKLPDKFSHALSLLIKACCEKLPENRPTFEEILTVIGNPLFIQHVGDKVDMNRFEEYQKKVIVDNSFIIKNNEDEPEDDESQFNIPQIPKEQKRSRKDFEVISKPSEDTDPFFITAEVNDTQSNEHYDFFQLKRDYYNDNDVISHFTTMLQVMYEANHKTINHPSAFIHGSPQVTFKEDAESLFDIFPRTSPGPPIVLFPFMSNGNLKDYKEDISITQKFKILYGIAAGMYYLHKNEIVHLNLNPRNILLNDQLEPIINLDITSRTKSNKENLFYLLPAFSFPYVAPELLDFKDGQTNTDIDEEKADIYSFAMIAYFLFSGLEPWNSCSGYQSILIKTLNNERPIVDNIVQYPFNKLILDCWYTSPGKRPTFKAILSRIGSSDFIRSIENLEVEQFKEYQKTVVDEKFIFPIQLYRTRKIEDFKIDKLIGTGTFGSVRLAVDLANNYNLAYKEIPYNEDQEKNGKFIDREIKILSSMNFPSIVPLYGIILPEEGRKQTIILFPFAQNGDLDKLLAKTATTPEWTFTQKCITAYGIAMGMYKLHEKDIIHRDLKPQNILINEFFEPWITDFGLSKFVDKNQTMYQSMAVGSPAYMPPEALANESEDDHREYDGKAADVYSFGILINFLFSGIPPWQGSKNQFALINKIIRGDRPTIPSTTSDNLKQLIESCWHKDPHQRPTFKQILEIICDSKFFKEINSKFDDYTFYQYQVKLGELDFIKYSDQEIYIFSKESAPSSSQRRKIFPSIRLPPCITLKNLADSGDAASQYMYGTMVRDGNAISKDLKEAATYFKMSSDQGNLDALIAYALCLKDGSGVEKNDAEAIRLMTIAAEKDNPDAQVILAGWYTKERPRRYGLAYEILRKAEANKQPDAPAMIGSLMEKRKLGTIPSQKEIMELYKKSCDMASPEGMYHMATFYQYGLGVEKNTDEAARLYRIAAKNESANQGPAAFSLSVLFEEIGNNTLAFETADFYRQQDIFAGYLRCADLYERGVGVPKDEAKANKYLEIAKDPRFVKDQMTIGLIYSRGKGVVRNKNKAFYWTEVSAQNGSAAGQANLARFYLDGYGCEPNIEEAEKWGKMSAEQGNDHAYMVLARLYNKKQKSDEELECLKKACQLGNEKLLVDLGKKYKELKKNKDAINCFTEAAESRVPLGMFYYGKELISGKHVKKDINEGVKMLESAADVGCREAIKKVINIYKEGEYGIPKDPQKVQKYDSIYQKLPRHNSKPI